MTIDITSWTVGPLLLALASGSPAHASIKGAPWGASLRALQKSFPGGITSERPEEADYVVGRNIFDSKATLRFTVSKKGGLTEAGATFVATDVETGAAQLEAKKISRKVTAVLTEQFGPPMFIDPKGGGATWLDSDGTISLGSVDGVVFLHYVPDDAATKLMRIGYADLRWHEPLSAAQARYPRGVARTEQNGDTTYTVVRTVAGHPNAVTLFTFAPQIGLTGALVAFPRAGTRIDFEKQEFVPPDDDEKKATFADVRAQLVAKYGAPESENAEGASWGAGTVVIFLRSEAQGVAISFNPPRRRTESGL